MAVKQREDGRQSSPAPLTQSAVREVASDRAQTTADIVEPGHYYESRTQAKGFVEQLHAPQPSDRGHWGSRWNAINPVDTNSIRNLGNAMETAYKMYEENYVPSGMEEYVRERRRIQDALESNQINAATAVRERNRLRNAAYEKFGASRRGLEMLDRYERSIAGYNDSETQMNSYVKQGEQIKQMGLQMGLGVGPEISSPDFEGFKDQVMEIANMHTQANVSQYKLQKITNDQNIDDEEKVQTAFSTIGDSIAPIIKTAFTNLKSGKMLDERTLAMAQTSIDSIFSNLIMSNPNLASNKRFMNWANNTQALIKDAIQSMSKATDYQEQKRKLDLISTNLHLVQQKENIRGAQLDNRIKETKLNTASLISRDLENMSPEATKLALVANYGVMTPQQTAAFFAMGGGDKGGMSDDTYNGLGASVLRGLGTNPDLLNSPMIASSMDLSPDYEMVIMNSDRTTQTLLKNSVGQAWLDINENTKKYGSVKGADGKLYTPADTVEAVSTKNGIKISPKKGFENNGVANALAKEAQTKLSLIYKTAAGCSGTTCDYSSLYKNKAFLDSVKGNLDTIGIKFRGK